MVEKPWPFLSIPPTGVDNATGDVSGGRLGCPQRELVCHLTAADLLLALLTKGGGLSSTVHEEICYAKGQGKLVVPSVEADDDTRKYGLTQGNVLRLL